MLEALLTAELFSRAADLIEPETAWASGWYARDGTNSLSLTDTSSATCWCAVGALAHVAGMDAGRFESTRAHRRLSDHVGGIPVQWNDRAGQAEVVSTLRQIAADALAPQSPTQGDAEL